VQSVRVYQTGGPEVLRYEQHEIPDLQPGQVLLRIEATGVNFVDVYYRSGLYPRRLPYTPGAEASGVIEALAPDVQGFHPGDRVATAMAEGAYAEYALAPADHVVPVPQGIDARAAAAVLLQGMTAHYLTSSTYAIRPGDRVLIHAAAGGTGRLLVQMAKLRGAVVYGTVSSEEKAAMARESGADAVIDYRRGSVAEEIRQLTGGEGVHVVYDGVGRATFEGSLASLRTRGVLVLFGAASGPVPPLDPKRLEAQGSVFLTRPSLRHYTTTRQEVLERADRVFSWLLSGDLRLHVDRVFSLAEAAEAHRALEARETSGKILLIAGR
jgi:NADPH2:quinone reductase